MRSDIFYWKCDSGLSPEAKKQIYFQEKYDSPEWNASARRIAEQFSGGSPESFQPLRADGNHLTYRFSTAGKAYLLRIDPGGIEDDYMLAESSVMRLLHEQGLPVPNVLETDISLREFPFRWQIMEFVSHPCLNTFAKAGTLKRQSIARQAGTFLARLHAFRFPGFGFLNTDELQKSGNLQGLDATCLDYFRKRLAVHLEYLLHHGFLSESEYGTVNALFSRAEALLKFGKGSLLHRDFTFWNMLGTESELAAVIDWDDCVIGDPMDDLGIVNCFQDKEFMEELIASYAEFTPIGRQERTRIALHTLRNMLWKTMIRDYMGYFEKGNDFFLATAGESLRETTVRRLKSAIRELEEQI